MAQEFSIACTPCTNANKGIPVLAIETGRQLIDRREATNANLPFPDEGGDGKILLLRLSCPRCSRPSFFYPTVHHYTCQACGHRAEDYVRGDTPTPTPFAGQGIRLSEGMTTRAENDALLRQLRQGSIGGWGS